MSCSPTRTSTSARATSAPTSARSPPTATSPTCSAGSSATRARSPSRARSRRSPPIRARSGASPTAACCARATRPTSSCSTRRRSTAVRRSPRTTSPAPAPAGSVTRSASTPSWSTASSPGPPTAATSSPPAAASSRFLDGRPGGRPVRRARWRSRRRVRPGASLARAQASGTAPHVAAVRYSPITFRLAEDAALVARRQVGRRARKSSRASLTSAGRSCWVQWPQPGRITERCSFGSVVGKRSIDG